MTKHKSPPSFAERYQSHEGRRGVAAAMLCMDVSDLVAETFESAAKSGLRKKDIAEALGVSPGRVSQLLRTDGNITIAALAKLMYSMGFEAEVSARPMDADEDGLDCESEAEHETAVIASINAEMARWSRRNTFASESVGPELHDANAHGRRKRWI